MNEDLKGIMDRLKERLAASPDRIAAPPVYLDPEAVAYFFQTMTGLTQPPPLAARADSGASSGKGVLVPSFQTGVPDHVLLEVMEERLKEKIPVLAGADDVESLERQYVRISGVLEATHFPDGKPNLEIAFAGIRGVLFHNPACFSSVIRPFLSDDRFFSLSFDVEAIVYLAGGLERMIFYHQTYGDNQEHVWLPLAPAVIRSLPRARPDSAGCTAEKSAGSATCLKRMTGNPEGER